MIGMTRWGAVLLVVVTGVAFLAAFCLGTLAGERLAATAGEPGGGDLPRFLPNSGNSVYEAKGLLRRWPPGGPKELWRVEIGWGKSAVVEAAGQAFTAAETDDKQWAVCLDPLTGATRWKRLLLDKPNRHFERGPVTSPVVDGDRVYYIPYANHEGDVWEMRSPIVCLRTDGAELWRADKTFWATEGSTPLVVGDTLYVGADNPERVVLVALDKRTGALRWATKVPSEKPRELGAPASLTYQVVDGVPQVIVATYGTRELLGVHAATGEIMWRYPYPADIIIGLVCTPVAVGPRLFVSGGEGKGKNFSACLEMRAEGGRIAFKEIYRSTELQTNMFNTPAVWQDAVFGFGGNNRAGFLHSTNLADGRLLWKEEGKQWTNERNLVVADGLLFALSKDDELVMAEASRERYRELGRVRPGIELGRPQQPTIANGRMYLRGNTWVVCYQVAGQGAAKEAEAPAGGPLATGAFRWTSTGPLLSPAERPGETCYSVKDPSVVFHGGQWHVFCTIRGKVRSHQMEYFRFKDWDETAKAERRVLAISDGYYCAPQVFYFTPQKKWYLIYQASDPKRKPSLQPACSTADKLDDPGSWTPPKLLFDEHPASVTAWIDFWVICDEAKAHLFFTSLNGQMWRAETRLADFPGGWSMPKVVLRGDIFEASHTYRLKGRNEYLTLVEAQAGGRRYYKAYLADRLDGQWKPVADTLEKPFAAAGNVRFEGDNWSESFSHGELLRAGHDERLEVDPADLRFLYQGVLDKDKAGKPYGQIPWRLGLLKLAK